MFRANRPIYLIMQFLCAVLLCSGTTSYASSQETHQGTTADIKQSATKTYEALKHYTAEQRNEAIATARKSLDELDARIGKLQKNLDTHWQNMSEATRQKLRETLNALQQKRKDVAEWYGGMRHSSKDAWEDVKKGFAESYTQLVQAFDKAKKDFENK